MYMLYWDCLDHWGSHVDADFPDLKEITDFSVLIKEKASASAGASRDLLTDLSMKYDALTFDTQVVMTNSFDFDGGLLGQLKQFKDGQIEILISEIVNREIARHLRQNTAAAKAAIDTAHRKAKLYGLPVEACAIGVPP